MGNLPTALEVLDLWKGFPSGDKRLEVLRGVDLTVQPGEVVAILGASGSGKTTLLHLIGALDRPDRGTVRYGEQDVTGPSEEGRAALRNRYVGFIFQYHHLLAEFTARENVAIPLLIGGWGRVAAWDRARELLALVGLEERGHHRPAQLSGGEQQRVALARALANRPPLVLADEPTGNLDRATGEALFRLLYSLSRQGQQSWVVATHNEYLAEMADTRWRLEDGVLRPVGPAGRNPSTNSAAPGRDTEA
ncbi:MAG: ABC transporter ATP-binding protein [Candidatus Eisenbacteria bacterium]